MTAVLRARPPEDALAALKARGKRLEPSFSWQDTYGEINAAMFTVAKSTGFDVLRDIHEALVRALEEGRTLKDFAADLTPVLQAKGWWGRKTVVDPETGDIKEARLGSPSRLRTIFNANMRVSYAAGHWAQFERTKRDRPYLRYVAILDRKTRPEHAARHDLVLPVDDPYWNVWAPPCGWNCRCMLQSLSERDVERLKPRLKFLPPPDRMRDFRNRRTAEVVRLPEGIDPGWGHNPGKAGFQAASRAAEKLIDAPPELAAAVVASPDWLAKPLAKEFEAWVYTLERGAAVQKSVQVVGALSQATLDFLANRGVRPATGAITVMQDRVGHILRDIKRQLGTAAAVADVATMPTIIAKPQAVLWDLVDPALLYVFPPTGAGPNERGKFVVRVDHIEKPRAPTIGRVTLVANAVRTAGVVDVTALSDVNRYQVIEGRL